MIAGIDLSEEKRIMFAQINFAILLLIKIQEEILPTR